MTPAEGKAAQADDEVQCCDLYWCPTVAEVECPLHSGFDVCCSDPERHENPEATIVALRVQVETLQPKTSG